MKKITYVMSDCNEHSVTVPAEAVKSEIKDIRERHGFIVSVEDA